MCKTYNTIGSLSTLKSHLEENNIHDFKSLQEVIDFQNSYASQRKELVSHHENLIEQEKTELQIELTQIAVAIESQKKFAEKRLKDEIEILKHRLDLASNSSSTNFFIKIAHSFTLWNLNRQLSQRERNFNAKVYSSVRKLVGKQKEMKSRYQFLSTKFHEAIEQSSKQDITELERKKGILDQASSFIYGAQGEQKVVSALETLSDEYYLINDFNLHFSPAIYYKQENEFIKSIQIDSLLVAPSGIFLIEAKNWSEKSLENLSLRSPVKQIKRTSFALYMLLNNQMSNFHLHLDDHHWGDRKISTRNLIVLINSKPKEEFQFVKVLSLNELLGYINYFKPVFSSADSERIAEFLLRISNKNAIKLNSM